jgi:transcriptional regulator with XRE-family HTH domain
MLLGEKIKEAIQKSGFKTEEVAEHIGISYHNLYRLYKKDSFEVKYLLKIAEKLELPLGYFLNDETIGSILHSNSGQANYANQVGSNKQSINIGQDDCPQKLQALQEKYELLEKTVADKERTIQILMKGQ